MQSVITLSVIMMLIVVLTGLPPNLTPKVTNTLAYYATLLSSLVKSFIAQTPGIRLVQ